MTRLLVLMALLASLAAHASADAIGGCPEGQIWRGNPVAPGAMHHGGGECVPDPAASHGCAASPGATDAAWSVLALAAGLTILRKRRDKVLAR